MPDPKSKTVPAHEFEKIKDELNALHHEHDELKVALRSTQDLAGRWSAERMQLDAENAALKNENAGLRTALAALQARPVEAPATYVGGLNLPHGILVLADQKFMDEKWVKPTESQSTVAVDFIGPDAQYLANRQKDLPVETLADGTLRVIAPSVPRAAKLKNDADIWIQDNGATGNKVLQTPTRSSRLLAMDAARAKGVGIIGVEGIALGAIRVADDAQVGLFVVNGPDGKASEVRIKLR